MYSRMTIRNDPVQANLVQVWSLKFQHLVYAFFVDLVRSNTDLFRGAISTAEPSGNQLFAVFVQQFKSLEVRARGYLNELCKPIPDLCGRKCSEKAKIEEGVRWCMVGS